MKKTKKQKIIADLRKKMAKIEEKTPTLSTQNSEFYNYKPVSKFNNLSSQILTIDYSQISRDLKKTLFLSALIFTSLIILKYFLKA